MKTVYRKIEFCFSLFFFSFMLLCLVTSVSIASDTISVTAHYSNVTDELQTITVDFCDDWFLQPADQYNHKLMQASFAMAASGFRSKIYELGDLDHDIRDFFTKSGFTELRSDDFNKTTSINTIGTMIAQKKIGEITLIAVSISGNNYQNEWLSNLTIENEVRPKGFNSAANKVMQRVQQYITDHQLSGELRLWVAGYSRAAAVSNIFAADAVESQLFTGVFAYTFATPRTTREAAPDRYHSIFNFINPEDVVPLIPFSEWGYERYGTDMFLPSISTDSDYNEKYAQAAQKDALGENDLPIFNPRMRRELHTVLDYIAYFVNSADSYTRDVQGLMLKFYRDHDIKELLKVLAEKIDIEQIVQSIRKRDTFFRTRLYEFYNFLDFNTRIIFSSFLSNKFGSEEDYWDNSLSLQENIAFGHYDKSYRFWLFSSDDPEQIFTMNPDYIHFNIVGDVDVDVLDENGNFIQKFDHEGWFYLDLEDAINPDFHGKTSQTILYMERQGNQTMIELPGDQKYTVYIKSNKEQQLKVSTVKFSAEKLKADVLYIYYDNYEKGEGYPEVIDPATESLITKEQLEKEDQVQAAWTWEDAADYSPTAVMLLENNNSFIPKSLALIILAQFFVNLVLILLLILVVKVVSGGVRFVGKTVFGKEFPVLEDRLEIPERKKYLVKQ